MAKIVVFGDDLTKLQTKANLLRGATPPTVVMRDSRFWDGKTEEADSVVVIGDVKVPELRAAFASLLDDSAAPTLSSSTPADDATGVAVGANIVLTFSENIFKGAGDITIRRTDNDTILETIPVTDARVSIADAVVTINPTANLPATTGVYVLIPAGAFLDADDNAYVGISSKTTLNFTTA